jgi:DNA helicase-2/ATP-dependent DNA helicase PcrA
MQVSALWSGLNDAQRLQPSTARRPAAGVLATPLLVIAGAGTGKTNTLAHRVAYLLLNGVAPERLLLLTFTRRAAVEMTRRAQRAIAATRKQSPTTTDQGALRLPWAGTFHAIGNRLIRRYADRLDLDPNFSVLDRGDAADLLDVVRQRLGLDRTQKRFPRKDTCLAIYSHRVKCRLRPRGVAADPWPWCHEWEAELTQLFRQYVEAKLAQQVLDYDDLLLYWHVMMQEPTLAARSARPSITCWSTSTRTRIGCRRRCCWRSSRVARA